VPSGTKTEKIIVKIIGKVNSQEDTFCSIQILGEDVGDLRLEFCEERKEHCSLFPVSCFFFFFFLLRGKVRDTENIYKWVSV
jgi:hypothetical protein